MASRPSMYHRFGWFLVILGFLCGLGLVVNISSCMLQSPSLSVSSVKQPYLVGDARGFGSRRWRGGVGGAGRERKGPLVAWGRRSAKIANRKGAQEAIKTKLYAKIGKMVADSVKNGGSDPAANTKLAAIIKQVQYDPFSPTSGALNFHRCVKLSPMC
eukprot:963540-Amorphochlora_amoeboformis.AAC.2